MSPLARSIALVRSWLPQLENENTRRNEPFPFAVEFGGSVGISRAGDDRIEVSIAGRIRADEPHAAREDGVEIQWGDPSGPQQEGAPVEARHRSSGALADAKPMVWLQLLDDRGVALTQEKFLGRGVGIERRLHARIDVSTLAPLVAMESGDDAPLRLRLASGVHARVVTRTYGNTSGPQYHMEVFMLTLLAAGVDFPAPAWSMAPAQELVPEPSRMETLASAWPRWGDSIA